MNSNKKSDVKAKAAYVEHLKSNGYSNPKVIASPADITAEKNGNTWYFEINIIGKTNRDEIQNQMRLKLARKLQKRNVTEKSHTSYSQKWLSNVN